jgi:hypothetical protein
MGKKPVKFAEVLGRRYEMPVVIDRANGIDPERRTVELSIASDAPIDHWFGRIILDHSPGSMRMDRMNQGAPLLLNHNSDRQIGVLENVRVEDGKTRATARFSRSDLATEIFQDVQDGIRRNTSVGFILHALDLESKSDSGPDTYRSMDWEPVEGTIASVPRDISVGVNRQLASEDQTCDEGDPDCGEAACPVHGNSSRNLPPPAAPTSTQIHTRSITMQPNTPTTPPAANPFEAMQARNDSFVAFAIQFAGADEARATSLREMAREFALTEKTEQELFAKIQEMRSAWATAVPAAAPLTLTPKEQKQYSIGRAILTAAGMKTGGEDLPVRDRNCFEFEISQELQRVYPRVQGAPVGDFRMPTNVPLRGLQKRAGLDVGTVGKGKELMYVEEGDSFIEMLRNAAKCLLLGGTVLAGLQGDVEFAGQTGAGTVSWVGENPGVDVGSSALTLARNVKLSPKIAQSSTSYSRKLLAQSLYNVDNIVQADLVRINSLEVDRVAIHGSGSGFQPLGIYGQTGVNPVAFGGAPTFAKIVDMETAIAAANADIGTMAYLTTPEIRGTCKKTAQLANTIALPIWQDGEMNGYRAEATNQISKTMLASAATGGTEHGMVFGVWAFLLFGEWGALEIITDPFTLKKQGMIEITSYLMVDIALRYAQAFSKSTGQTP